MKGEVGIREGGGSDMKEKLQELMILLHLITLLCSRRGKLMARTVARANLGLTHPSDIDTPKVYGYQCKREA
ncbi:hypothetical protein DVH24_039949 [Malus domestica]|uniref:Uncharacterized protein n=1 Tax=Malus domestica TaxID=3750 RepID=A0A498I2E3_MALDO|nr:hypothetical protein DVH24_039949 [Malus domestica]